MNRKKLTTGMAALSVVTCCCGGGILARTETSVRNPFRTGVVDIALSEYRMVEGKEEPYEDVQGILPGQTISKIPRIENRGNDCWVRAKLTLRDTEESVAIEGMGDRWKAGGDGYYYYQDILPTGGKTDLFQQVRIPEDFSQEEEGKAFELEIDADAIQSQNFTPDFTADAPWGPVQIQRCIRDGNYDLQTMTAADSQSLRVVYQGESKTLLAEPEDFFASFPVLMPGDTYADTAELKNDSAEPMELYFRSQAEHGEDLLKRLQLTIETEINGQKTTVYEGALEAEPLREDVCLGTLQPGASGSFRFTLSVPKELDNPYTVLNNQVQWIFSTEPIQPEKPGVPTEVRTGDNRKTAFFLLASGLFLGAGAWMLKRKPEDGHEAL